MSASFRPSVCPHDCPSVCALQVEVTADGRIGRVRGGEQPYTDGVICAKVARYAERAHHPLSHAATPPGSRDRRPPMGRRRPFTSARVCDHSNHMQTPTKPLPRSIPVQAKLLARGEESVGGRSGRTAGRAPHTLELKVEAIGNSRGVRLPKALLARYAIGDAVVVEQREEGLLLRSGGETRLSWEDTYKEMARAREDWSDLEATAGDGLEKEPW